MTPRDRTLGRRSSLVLFALCFGQLMIAIDVTVVNLALTAIRFDLQMSTDRLSWVVNAYIVSFAATLMLAGRLGDFRGHRTMIVLGYVVFTLASVACGLAPSAEVLIGARFVQGLGGALVSASTLAIITREFPDGRARAMSLGLFSAVGILGSSLGLVAGGFLTAALGWEWIFLVNLPIGVVTIGLCAWLLDGTADTRRTGSLDLAGATLMTGGLLTLIFGIVHAAETHPGDPVAVGSIAAGLGLLTGFVAVEARTSDPLIPLRLFASRTLAGGSFIRCVMTTVILGQFFIQSLYLQEVLGLDPLEAGLAFLPVNVLIGALSLGPAQWLIRRYGSRVLTVGSMAAIVLATAWFAREPVDAVYLRDLLPPMILFGTGAGVGFLATMLLTLQDTEPEHAGVASGMVNTAQQLGSALGIAVVASVASVVIGETAEPAPAELLRGYHAALWSMVALGALGAVAAAWLFRTPTRPGDRPRGPETFDDLETLHHGH